MADEFFVPVTVRGYETDVQGHLNQAVYLQYAEHARWELFGAAGIRQQDLQAAGIGPVVLETTIRYKRELRAGDKVEVTCSFEWGEGKTFRLTQVIRKVDGTVAAEVTAVGGFLDLTARRLITEPSQRIGSMATDPTKFGL